MAPQPIIDSHIHLWPQEMSNEASHAWMTPPDMPLAKQHLLKDYYAVADQTHSSDADVVVRGVVYVETDVRYGEPNGDVASWTKGPLDEISFLRNVVEGHYGGRDTEMLVALVPWAPMDQPTHILEEYLKLAEERAGSQTWQRVKGFRFLLQFYTDQSKFRVVVLSSNFIANLKLLGKRGFSFDIGVDQHSAGIFQLEIMSKAMHRAHEGVAEEEKVIFIINHMCKPDYEHVFPQNPGTLRGAFDEWCDAVSAMSSCDKTYMKLSGQFSESPTSAGLEEDIAAFTKPWVRHIMSCFGPRRTMFGSDWPVCNVKGPRGGKSWVAWKDVVKLVLSDADYRLTESDQQWIWMKTAGEAYCI
ncbi:L-rhamnono-gamma-lactonase [Elasticomyces elasticus]|nr:L-rhamnono-gamma-lactonase [Elasticomyces elasticus]KAK3653467.1 L-rhamnono-gamma-lactonase [Elasticomyces elasticus]KAK4926011.1 L-rhamnono-gamma-lactonase [Elasticomyces elasticus]KAK5768247.1 L-rhamnono-gamma-lactonase [Elasticomyces elasticus]